MWTLSHTSQVESHHFNLIEIVSYECATTQRRAKIMKYTLHCMLCLFFGHSWVMLTEKYSNKPNRSHCSEVNITSLWWSHLLLWLPTSLSFHFQPAKRIVSNLLSRNNCVSLCHTFSVSVFQQRDSLQPAPPADGCLDTMPPAQLLRKNLRAQTSPAERQTEHKVTAETQAVLNITKPPAAHTTQLNTSTWKRWWLFLGPYG